MGRAPCCDKANVKKGPWSQEEDATLKAYIKENGTGNWIALPQKIGLKRCGKSCRLRWLNYLRPNIKHGDFSDEEDQIICNLYISIGSRWSIIAAQLPGRTDNDIKNYWNTRLKKKLLGPPLKETSRFSSQRPKPNSQTLTLNSTALERIQLHNLQFQGINNTFSFYNNPALWSKLHPLRGTNDSLIPTKNTENEPSHNQPVTAGSKDQDSCETSSNFNLMQAELNDLFYAFDEEAISSSSWGLVFQDYETGYDL
ncbi:uncharacterized protein A4U43_C01F34580 [Asparagus officinalis]|uniref:Uncharacterized protein n=1 Tax=Asparagus officinalis TaxID=4686 RepID=A0A5P1FXL3_ASPOF|nr:transcription factor MYB36-like [Asparagus officinalis]ONK81950.1 uncharacterized protein A4U43_C01F34580 [Asparagus officinalis]